MINRANGRVLLRIALAGCLLAGCFAPAIYYAYKSYETDDLVGIAVNVNRPAPEVYEIVIQQIEKNKKYKIVKRDDKGMVLSVQKIGNEKETATVTVSALSPRSSRYSAVGTKMQGVDPAVQKQDAINSVLSLCAELGHECTPEEPKK
jgi:hypothetical protein